MDPISHGLLGSSLGYLAFGHRLGRAAALAGGLAALAPDADVFIRSATDPLLAIEHHRGFSHSLFFAPVGAAIASGLWMFWARWRPQAFVLWQCSLVAYVSHCLLDAATSYGTQLFWPLSRQRVGWDLISIIDPLFTLTLAFGLAWSLRRRGRRPVLIALSLGAAYLGLGGLQHARATAAQEELAAARGHRIERRETMPTLANNLVWRALYVADGQIHSDRIRTGWFSRPTVRAGWSLPLITEGTLTPAERERNGDLRSFQRFAWFSDHWVARSPADPTLLGDMRYTLSTEAFDPIWGIRFTPPGAPAEVAWVNRSRERKIDGTELWDEILGRDPRFHPPPDAKSAD